MVRARSPRAATAQLVQRGGDALHLRTGAQVALDQAAEELEEKLANECCVGGRNRAAQLTFPGGQPAAQRRLHCRRRHKVVQGEQPPRRESHLPRAGVGARAGSGLGLGLEQGQG